MKNILFLLFLQVFLFASLLMFDFRDEHFTNYYQYYFIFSYGLLQVVIFYKEKNNFSKKLMSISFLISFSMVLLWIIFGLTTHPGLLKGAIGLNGLEIAKYLIASAYTFGIVFSVSSFFLLISSLIFLGINRAFKN